MKAIAILGSTGSIGRQTLQVVESLPERFRVVALAAGGNIEELAGQIARHRPELVSVSDAAKAAELRERLGETAKWAAPFARDSAWPRRFAERRDASGRCGGGFGRRGRDGARSHVCRRSGRQ